MRYVCLLIALADCTCKHECKPGQVDDHGTCRDVAVSLQGLRWDMPCKPGHDDICDATVGKPTKTATLAGDPATTYDVTLRFRGVVEQEAYAAGSADGLWYVGGHPDNGAYNIYELATSAPAQVFYLNAGAANITHVFSLDYQKTIRIQGGATVTLTADAQDGSFAACASNTSVHPSLLVPVIAATPSARSSTRTPG